MYSLVMKKRKSDSQAPTIKDVKDIVAAVVLRSQEELALLFGKSFATLHKEIKDVDNRLILTKEELSQRMEKLDLKITSTNIRIDDLAFNRVKYEDFNKLIERVDKLEGGRGKKRVQ